MVTIRPSPFGRMALNAARQHRKEPVRLTRSVSSHICGVVSANGATSSTAAAHTSPAGVPPPSPRLAPGPPPPRPASQCSRSPVGCGPGAGTDDPSVELLMGVETPFQVEMAFGVAAAGRARDAGNPPDAVRGGPDVVGRDHEGGGGA